MSQQQQNRREFGKSLALGTAAAVTGTSPALAANPPSDQVPKTDTKPTTQHVRTFGTVSENSHVFHEAVRDIPVAGRNDVVVCGAGPAGVAAALAAARGGAKTQLLETHGCVGGIWTSGSLSLIIDSVDKPGIMAELRAELERRRAGHWIGSSMVYDPEAVKLLLEDLLLEAGVQIQLHTRVVGAVADERGRLSVVLTESKSGRQAWTAGAFIDCTGDGDVAAQAGCEFDLGQPQTGTTQPMSLMVLMTGPTIEGIARFIRGDAEPRKLGNPKKNLLAEFHRAGIDPSYGGPTIFRIREGLYAMMANHQYGVLSIDAADVTQATLQARREVHRLVDSLRQLGGVWRDLQIVAVAEQIGTREGRRIHGRYQVTGEDLRRGSRFDDSICHVRFGIDVHSTDPNKTKAIEAHPFKSKPYDIPLRALIARDVTGLLLAGRCISGDFIAHSSYRVTGDAVVMGEAAGVTAAIAAATQTLPHDVPFAEVAKVLQNLS